ncbi:MAG: hypothetical protein NZ580_06875 [Bacteroidia bacterium]|nr:hypothetical protein [Bacteroidia bacterium]MDW8235158.1 hypothetical protein [Bacteroidia bacterium]
MKVFLLLWLQTIQAELVLDKKQPRPLHIEYIPIDGGIITVSYKSPSSTRLFALHKYNADLRHEWSEELFDQSTGEEFIALAVVDSQIWAFTQKVEGTRRIIYGYLANLQGRFSIRGKPLLNLESVPRTARLELTYAPNRRYACLSIPIRAPADQPDKIAYILLGGGSYIAGEWELPYREKEIEIRRPIQPGHEGHLYALGTVRTTNSPFPQYFLFKLAPEVSLTLSVLLEVEGIYLIEPTFRVERGGAVRIAAFYTQRRGAHQVQGLLFARVESGFFLSNIRQTPLPTEVLQRFLSEKQIARGRGIPDLFLDHLIPRGDGGMLLIGEQFYITTSTFRDFYGFWYTQETYHYEDIVIFAIDSVGSLEWFRVIPKAQVGTSDHELSYSLLVGPEKLYFFYRGYARGVGAQVFVIVLDAEGELASPRPFIPTFRGTDTFYRKLTRQLNNREGLLTYTESAGRRFVITRVSLD